MLMNILFSEDLLLGDTFLRNVYSLFDFGSFITGNTNTPFIQLLSVRVIVIQPYGKRNEVDRYCNRPPTRTKHSLSLIRSVPNAMHP